MIEELLNQKITGMELLMYLTIFFGLIAAYFLYSIFIQGRYDGLSGMLMEIMNYRNLFAHGVHNVKYELMLQLGTKKPSHITEQELLKFKSKIDIAQHCLLELRDYLIYERTNGSMQGYLLSDDYIIMLRELYPSEFGLKK